MAEKKAVQCRFICGAFGVKWLWIAGLGRQFLALRPESSQLVR